MYFKEYEKTVEQIKTAVDLVKDYAYMNRCKNSLENYNRSEALNCLQDTIDEYTKEINEFGFLIDKVFTVRTDYANLDDQVVRIQLLYLNRHIPIYVLIREGKKELVKKIYSCFDKHFDN